MKLKIRNFRKIQNADIELNGITLLVGKNEQGKTSAAQALSAVLLNDSALFLMKKEREQLLNGAATSAVAHLEGQDGSAAITWPKGDYETKGTPPRASRIACGLTRFTSLEPKQRMAYLTELLRAEPSRKAIQAQLRETGLSDKEIIDTIARIELSGWDAVAATFEEAARDAKAVWKSITQMNWGKEQSASWLPEGWTDDLADEAESEIQKAIDAAEKSVQAAAHRAGFDEAKRSELQALVDARPGLRKLYEEYKPKLELMEENLRFMEGEMAKFPRPEAPALSCPACAQALELKQGVLVEVVTPPAERLEALIKEHSMMTEGLQQQRDAVTYARAEFAKITADGMAAKAAAEKLAAVKPAEPEIFTQEEALGERDFQRKRLAIFKAYHAAYAQHKRVLLNLLVAAKLGPAGIRLEALKARLEEFNAKCLKPLANTMLLEGFVVDDEMNVMVGVYPYRLLSAAAQFYTDTLLQIAFSKLEKADVLVIDGADIMVGVSRGLLLSTLLQHWAKPVLLTMSLSKPETAPADRESLKVYWIEDGITKEI